MSEQLDCKEDPVKFMVVGVGRARRRRSAHKERRTKVDVKLKGWGVRGMCPNKKALEGQVWVKLKRLWSRRGAGAINQSTHNRQSLGKAVGGLQNGPRFQL